VGLARTALNLIDGDDEVPPALLAALSDLALQAGLVADGTPGAERSPAVFERSLLAALLDRSAGAIGFNLDAMARAAGALRDRLAPEQWGLVRGLGDEFHARLAQRSGGVPAAAQALPALQRLALQLAAVTGAQTDRMTRDHGWRLLSVGRLAERIAGMARTMRRLVTTIPPGGGLAAAALLELFDSSITFRARYQRNEDLLALIDLLVLDDTNPRAFAGTLRRLRTELGKLPGPEAWRDELRALWPAQGSGLALDALRDVDAPTMQRLVAAHSQRLIDSAARLSDLIGQRYFAHADADAVRRV